MNLVFSTMLYPCSLQFSLLSHFCQFWVLWRILTVFKFNLQSVMDRESIVECMILTVFSVQCLVFRVQYSAFSVQWSVFSVQCSVFQFSVFSVQCSVYTVQCAVFSG